MPLTDKLYETLTPAQRLAAMVPAMARRDAAESARLFGTAPKFHYHAPDLEFMRGMRAVERMALHTALAMHRETAQWLLCLAVVGHGLTPEGALPVADCPWRIWNRRRPKAKPRCAAQRRHGWPTPRHVRA